MLPSLGPPPPLGATEELQQLGFAAHAALRAREPSAAMLVRLATRGAANLHLGRSHELVLEARRLQACAAEARGAWRRCVAASREWLAGAAPLMPAAPRGAAAVVAPPGALGEAKAGTGAAGGGRQLLEGRPLLDPMAALSQQLVLARALRRLGGATEAGAEAEAGEEPEEDSEEEEEVEAAEEAAAAAQAGVQGAAATELTTERSRRWCEQRKEASALESDARTMATLLLGASHPFVAEIEAQIEALAHQADHEQQRTGCRKRPREPTDEGI
jgi:hypothetical protein